MILTNFMTDQDLFKKIGLYEIIQFEAWFFGPRTLSWWGFIV
jgi:hypothetical protein